MCGILELEEEFNIRLMLEDKLYNFMDGRTVGVGHTDGYIGWIYGRKYGLAYRTNIYG